MIPKENVVLGTLIAIWDGWDPNDPKGASNAMREIGSALTANGYANAKHLTRAGYELAALAPDETPDRGPA